MLIINVDLKNSMHLFKKYATNTCIFSYDFNNLDINKQLSEKPRVVSRTFYDNILTLISFAFPPLPVAIKPVCFN